MPARRLIRLEMIQFCGTVAIVAGTGICAFAQDSKPSGPKTRAIRALADLAKLPADGQPVTVLVAWNERRRNGYAPDDDGHGELRAVDGPVVRTTPFRIESREPIGCHVGERYIFEGCWESADGRRQFRVDRAHHVANAPFTAEEIAAQPADGRTVHVVVHRDQLQPWPPPNVRSSWFGAWVVSRDGTRFAARGAQTGAIWDSDRPCYGPGRSSVVVLIGRWMADGERRVLETLRVEPVFPETVTPTTRPHE